MQQERVVGDRVADENDRGQRGVHPCRHGYERRDDHLHDHEPEQRHGEQEQGADLPALDRVPGPEKQRQSHQSRDSRHRDQRQADRSREFQAELDAAVAAGVPGIVARVRSGAQAVTFTAGVGDVASGRSIRAEDRFRIASITKSFVAALVVRLVEDRKLRLDDSAAHYLPEYDLDPAITVRHLLQHTSGLFDIGDDEE